MSSNKREQFFLKEKYGTNFGTFWYFKKILKSIYNKPLSTRKIKYEIFHSSNYLLGLFKNCIRNNVLFYRFRNKKVPKV